MASKAQIKIGVQFQTHGVDAPQFEKSARDAVALGVDSVFLWDHLVPFTGEKDETAWDSWVLIGALARELRTSSVALGVLVSPLTFRSPIILARCAVTAARLGNGEFILGVGAGGFIHDDELMNIKMSLKERMFSFANQLAVLRREIDIQNETFCTRVKIWVGGDGKNVTIPGAVHHADGWSGFGPPARFESRRQVVDQLRLKSAHPDSEFEISVLLTRQDERILINDFAEVGALHLIRSLRPSPDGTFDLQPIQDLLSQRL
ncbi:LLM class F420-dependent oxidoreductase [Actinomycetes bacterium]|nr:LLM class F420-dependent oxidoreductase [Actinomycetes bacterium]